MEREGAGVAAPSRVAAPAQHCSPVPPFWSNRRLKRENVLLIKQKVFQRRIIRCGEQQAAKANNIVAFPRIAMSTLRGGVHFAAVLCASRAR